MLRRHLRNLIRLSVVGATLSCQAAQADERLAHWLNATGDPAITSADLVTNGLEGSQVAPASYLDPRQIFEDIERESEGETGGSLGELPIMSAAPTAISSEELEGVGSSFNAGENKFVGSSDPAIALQQSNTARGVNVQRRSALSFDPRVRSYGVGQLYTQADGVLMLPVRPDLTTILGATDPWLIQSIDVLKGPYGASYGPGFAFIDVTTMQTPRYDCGPEAHARTGYTFHGNGNRHYARETVYGGSSDYGYIFSYGYRNGAQYQAGGTETPDLPGAYKANNVLAQIGLDLTADSRVEMRYQHLEQSNTIYPGQIFKLDSLTTDLYSVAYIEEDSGNPWSRLFVNGWYYRTPMNGSTYNDSYFNTQKRIEASLDSGVFANNSASLTGTTNGRLSNAGGKAMLTFGDTDDVHFDTGVDLRYTGQRINEDFVITDGVNGPVLFPVNTNLPNSEATNPGAFMELSAPMLDYWTARVGGRVDYVYTYASGVDPLNTSLPDGDRNLKQGDVLYSFYQMNDLELNSNWTATVGFGQAQRSPTLIQRYADGVFLGINQSGFSRVIGDQNLAPERVWQADASLTAEYEYSRGQVGVFYAVIDDYIGYRGAQVVDLGGARLLRYINVPQATLTGFEAYGEHDMNTMWTAFAAGQFVYGEDNQIHAPLIGIPPLDTRLGIRLHDDEGGGIWNVELAARMVAPQNRLGELRLGNQTTVDTVPLETRTPGFFSVDMRGFWSPRENLNLTGGILNLTNTKYLEHLDLRLPADNGFNAAFAYAPGITPYMGVEWNY